MQVNFNPNRNRSNSSFRAKLKLEGARVENIPKELVKKLENTAKKIGTDKDIITIQRSYMLTNKGNHYFEMGELGFADDYIRDNYINIKINKKKEEDVVKHFETDANDPYFEDIEFVNKALYFLKKMTRSKKYSQ